MSIQEHLNKIRNAVYGHEVRESIAKGIETAYDDASENGNANMEVKVARGTHPNLRSRLEEVDNKQQQNTAQLQQKAKRDEVRLKTVPIGLNDTSSELLTAISGGAGTSFNLLSQPRRKSVTEAESTFLTVSSNLLDTSNMTNGFNLEDTTGNEVANAAFGVSGFIPVNPSSSYSTKLVVKTGFYDTDKQFISIVSAVSGTISTPSTAYYIKAVVEPSNYLTAQINVGSVLLPYEKYKVILDQNIEVAIPNKSITNEKLADDILVPSSNLIDKSTLKAGFSLNGTNGGEVISPSNNITGFVAVKPTTNYTMLGTSRYAFYDGYKNFIKSEFTPDNPALTVTSPSAAKYARFVIADANKGRAQVNESSSLLPYEDYGAKFLGIDLLKLKDADMSALAELSKKTASHGYIITGKSEGFYTSPSRENVANGTTNPLNDKSASDIYSLYDDLMTRYPNYITRTLLGNEESGLPIYRYDFQPIEVGDNPELLEKPRIVITTGTHGSEKASIWSLYLFMKDMCEDWKTNELLETLRFNVDFTIIPIVNPWGFNNNSRVNMNGVDINRNSPVNWYQGTQGEQTYGGTAPLSELSAHYVDNVLKTLNNVVYFCDFHNFSSHANQNYFIWNLADYNEIELLSKKIISKLSRMWRNRIAYLPQADNEFFGYTSTNSPAGSLSMHANKTYGFHSSTFEICERFMREQPNPIDFSALVFELGTEAIGNWLLTIINHLK